MFTQCPHCNTCFEITPEQLKAAQGDVRCGRCFGAFNALEHLIESAPESPDDTNLPTLSPITAPSTPTPPPATHHAYADRSQQLVEEIQAIEKPRPNLFWLWSTCSIALGILLLGQYSYANLQTLAQKSYLRPLLSTMCSVAKCQVPLMKAPNLITLVNRNIHNHPQRKDVLQVKAEIANKAPFPQSFPLIALSLQDITGHTIAERHFKPREYLADTSTLENGMAPQQSIHILLELVDPGEEAVGFIFDFL